MDTDYETFTSVYSCAPLGIEFPWILTRETNPPDETVMHNVCFMEELDLNMCSFFNQIEIALDAFRRNNVKEPDIVGYHVPECEYGYTPSCADEFPPPE